MRVGLNSLNSHTANIWFNVLCAHFCLMHKIFGSFRFVIIFTLGVILVGFFSYKNLHKSHLYVENPSEQAMPAAEYYKNFPQNEKTPAVIELGLYIDNLYNLDLKSMSFKARGWLWYNWTKLPMIDGEINSGQMGLFDLNFIDETSVNQVISSKENIPYTSNSGVESFENDTSFDATLSASSLDLRKFPFDKQVLQILVTDPVHTSQQLIYKVKQFRLPPSRFNMPAYKLNGINFAEEFRIYTSNFFDESNVSIDNGSPEVQSQASFNISISRNTLTSLLEYVAPVVLVTFMTLSLVRLGKDYWEVKLQTASAAILSLIFLQNSFKQGLPTLSYLTCMDIIFLFAYLICILTFVDGFQLELSKKAGKYDGLYGKLGIAIFAIAPLSIFAWLSFPL